MKAPTHSSAAAPEAVAVEATTAMAIHTTEAAAALQSEFIPYDPDRLLLDQEAIHWIHSA